MCAHDSCRAGHRSPAAENLILCCRRFPHAGSIFSQHNLITVVYMMLEGRPQKGYASVMTEYKRPTAEQLGKLAENQPELLNLLVAYFVFEWRNVRMGNPPHGVDQTGVTCHIPNYIGMWTDRHTGRCGVSNAVSLLLQCPPAREPGGPGYLSEWLKEI